ncbi:hypothetical protein P4N68_06390 [Corynebacterium felinum]|uniref:CRISPR-associated endonuclease/helicase Cas3 n=1 Tax=Corynebacterium felinum TaxID=131318 RepID=A0ABU2BA52_9CORY|nr:HD domain-containing protein [Corynebacterium felinum]MDF5820708.1 hypothetical protein [Corynebacterium felinum]MDR7355517.1 CRISPR-associated endonuclease/helicase Cas3 [Corynebacterium felinum]WJY94867.1 helicase Cas3 [Corynebacterium felinum]
MLKRDFPTFADFFQEVHGFAPYNWQIELSNFVASTGKFPDRIAIPTGLGKTSAIDVAVWALAKQIVERVPRSIGQRIFHVVERRIVVDGAYQHVERLQEAVTKGETPAVRAVASALSSLQHSAQMSPLGITSFHGSKHDQFDWLDVNGAKIIVTTATQFTMRVLGQAPGVSSATRPIHAALTALDSVVLFDEPQLAAVQVSTLRDVAEIQAPRCEKLGVPPMQISLLGATIPPELVRDHDSQIHVNVKKESKHLQILWKALRPVMVERLMAQNPNKTVQAITESIVTSVFNFYDRTPQKDAKAAVVVNSVQQARLIAEKLESEFRKRKDSRQVKLITSRIRAADRPKESSEIVSPNHILVATQTVEVGADFSVDFLATELAPWPSLIQRFGRLNRNGQSQNPQGLVVIPLLENKDAVIGSDASKAVYGEEPLLATKELLALMTEENQSISASLCDVHEALEHTPNELLKRVWPAPARTAKFTFEIAKHFLATTTPYSPPLDVDAWLTGPDSTKRAELVTIAWRADLNTLQTCVLQPAETIELSIHEVLAFLGEDHRADSLITDIDLHSFAPNKLNKEKIEEKLNRIRVSFGDQWFTPEKLSDLRPGCTIVFATCLGGYSPSLGFLPNNAHCCTMEVPDVSLALALENSQPFWAPLNANTYISAGGENWDEIDELLNNTEILRRERRSLIAEHIRLSFPQFGSARVRFTKQGKSVLLCRNSGKDSHSNNNCVTLAEHSTQVKKLTEQKLSYFDIDSQLREDLLDAAFLHDHGKAIDSFQMMLGKLAHDPLLAKSYNRHSISSSLALLPESYDHASAAAIAAEKVGFSPLVCHLIASHHGGARGVNRLNAATAKWINRFVALSGEFGLWGLCWLESVLRISDWEASAFPDPSVSPLSLNTDVINHIQHSGVRPDHDFCHDFVLKETPLLGLALRKAKTLNWFASMGVLSFVSLYDEKARLEFRNGVPIILSNTDIDTIFNKFYDFWQGFVVSTNKILKELANSKLSTKNQKLKISPALVDYLEKHDWPDDYKRIATALWCSHLPRDSVKEEYVVPRWINPSTGEEVPQCVCSDTYLLPLSLLARNSSAFNYPDSFDVSVLWSAGKGWSHETELRGAGGLDMASDGSSNLATDSLSRSLVVPLALFGVLSLGKTLAPYGNGTFSFRRGSSVVFNKYQLPIVERESFTISEFEFLIRVAPELISHQLLIADVSTRANEKMWASTNSRITRIE